MDAVEHAVGWMEFRMKANEANGDTTPSKRFKRFLKSVFIARIGLSRSDGPTSYEQAIRLGRQYLHTSR